MKLFDILPSDLFSVLASPNRVLYSDALDVLYNAYRETLKIPEEKLYTMLRSKLEQQLADASFEGEDIDEEELRDISGRARFLIRKLCAKGWFEKERGEDFEEYITVPGYSSQLLELFHQLRDDRLEIYRLSAIACILSSVLTRRSNTSVSLSVKEKTSAKFRSFSFSSLSSVAAETSCSKKERMLYIQI